VISQSRLAHKHKAVKEIFSVSVLLFREVDISSVKSFCEQISIIYFRHDSPMVTMVKEICGCSTIKPPPKEAKEIQTSLTPL